MICKTAIAIVGAAATLLAFVGPSLGDPDQTSALEDIYVLRSVRERQPASADWCAPSRAGFEPFPADADRFFSFWSV